MKETHWQYIFQANFSLLPHGFVVGVLIPLGYGGSPTHSVFLNNLVSLINCESLKEIGEMACFTPALSPRGQTYRSSFQKNHFIFFFQSTMTRKRYSTPYLFYVLWIELFEKNLKNFYFHQPRLVLALLLPNDMVENFPRFLLMCFLSISSCSFNVTAAIVKVFRSPCSRSPRSDLVLVPGSRVG